MAPQFMQAIRVHQFGGPEQLRLEETACPQPQPGGVLIQVQAAGVLPAEWKLREGQFQGIVPTVFPYIPGSAVAGTIAEVGAGVTEFQPGQEVFGRTPNGAYAEYTTAPVTTLARKPKMLSFDEAATISGGATVAWTALFENGALRAGQRVLVHGGAGGVGLFAVQFAKWKGAQVLATASTANVDFVRSLGADEVIDYTAGPFEQGTCEVDLVLDTMGGEVLQRSLAVVKPGGTLVSLLEQPDQKGAQRRGIHAMKNSATLPFPSTQLLEAIAQLLENGHIKTLVGSRFLLREARQAHELSQTGHGRGRIVLQVAEAIQHHG